MNRFTDLLVVLNRLLGVLVAGTVTLIILYFGITALQNDSPAQCKQPPGVTTKETAKPVSVITQQPAVVKPKVKKVLVYVSAPWCQYCPQMSAILASPEVKAKLKDFVVIRKNLDSMSLKERQQLRVMGVPLILIYNDSKLVGRIDGAVSKQTVLKALDK